VLRSAPKSFRPLNRSPSAARGRVNISIGDNAGNGVTDTSSNC